VPARDSVGVQERRQRIEQLGDIVRHKVKHTLSTARNLELVVLKCHLLIEYMFNQFIDLTAPTEGVIETERFTFKQKRSLIPSVDVAFLQSLLKDGGKQNARVWRNKIANTQFFAHIPAISL